MTKRNFESFLDKVPFVNGGLFDCLDDVYRKTEDQPTIRLDGFSDNPRESLTLPNELFFGNEQHADLSEEFDDRRKPRRVGSSVPRDSESIQVHGGGKTHH